MRILSVQMRGFGPFREQQHLDLEGFTDGLFLITGRTGAGKSSLLDAVCFALYGSVPRYDGVESRLRSDFSAPDEPSEVSVRFETAGGEYLITRSPAWERPKKNGTGTTPQKAEARLARRDGDGWEVVMSGPRAVGPEIERLLGLTRAQFLQVVLLAQNRFQEFLRAGNDDRQAVLRSLFGSERFDRFEQALAERRRDEEDRGGADRADLARQIELLAELCASSGAEMPDAPDGDARDSERIRDWSVECERLLAESCVLARAASTAADTALEASITERDAARRESEEYERFILLAERRDRWTSRAAEREQTAARRDRAAAAELIRPWHDDLRAAEQAAGAAEERNESTATAVVLTSPADADAVGDSAAALSTRAALIEQLSERLGTIEAAILDEAELPRLQDEERAATEQEAAALRSRETLRAEADALPDRRAAALRVRDAQALRLAHGPELERQRDRLDALESARHNRDSSLRQREQDQRAEAEASAASARAVAEQLSVFRQRLDAQAAVLATDLSDGEACPVCGSTDHPSPAAPRDDITDATLDAARERVERAEQARAQSATASRQSEVGVAMAAASVAEGIAELVASWTEVGDDAAEPIGDDSAVPEAGDDGASALTPGSHSAAVSASDLDTDEGIRAARERTAAALSLVAESARRHATAETELARCDARAQAIASEMAAVQNDAERAAVRRAEAAERRTSLEARIDRVRAEAGSLAELRTQLRDRRDCLTAHAEASRVVVAARARHTQSSRAVEAALAASDFDTLAEAVASLVSAGVLSELTRLVSEDTTEGAVVAQALADLGDVPEPQDGRVAEAEAATIAASEARDVAVQAAARLDELSGQVADRATRLRADASRAADALQRGRVVTQLSNTVSGRLPNTKRMRLESFVLAGELELIVAAANVRLEVMTSGRFRLVHDDEPGYKNARAGLGLAIEDAHTGRSRSTRSLSGGESFLASLALALGLAEVVTARSGGVRLDTLFIDEGFGSLDAHTLEIAMATLDGLRSGGRTVGVISHVGSMIEQIPATVRVRARPAGDSVIEVSGL